METGKKRRMLVIGLDGLEISYAQKLMDAGEMPALAALRDRSASFLLDHGSAQRTGLAWEHVASGLSPDDAHRWSAVEFDPQTYSVWQEGARFVPFFESLNIRTLVFDPPYVDLRKTTRMQGIVGWGAHDPGTSLAARPQSLLTEMRATFGNYPSPKWIYGLPCYSVERCEQMGTALAEAVRTRLKAAKWLMTEKIQEWDLYFVVTGELHSAIEGLWHGVDPEHPLHSHPSASAAAAALLNVHKAVDQLVGELVEAAGDVDVVAFAMGGMGSNQSDTQSMALLPELMYRHAFNRALLTPPSAWTASPQTPPILPETEDWNTSRRRWFAPEQAGKKRPPGLFRKLLWKLKKIVQTVFPQLQPQPQPEPQPEKTKAHIRGIKQPANAYQRWWAEMRAFALPSFYDGKVRINLNGREKNGVVLLEDYEKVCAEIEAMLRECRDPRTGEPVVKWIERPQISDPLQLDSSDADMTIVWQGTVAAFEHPRYGLIGPVPFRRTGGHTGPYGMAYIAASGIEPGERGIQSAFNVIPTVVELLGADSDAPLSGQSLFADQPKAEAPVRV